MNDEKLPETPLANNQEGDAIPLPNHDRKHEKRGFNVLPPEIWRQYEGKVIIYSEDEQRVIGVGDTEDEAFTQAEASGIKGLWHYHWAARWGEEQA